MKNRRALRRTNDTVSSSVLSISFNTLWAAETGEDQCGEVVEKGCRSGVIENKTGLWSPSVVVEGHPPPPLAFMLRSSTSRSHG